jgi:hypothetical protein
MPGDRQRKIPDYQVPVSQFIVSDADYERAIESLRQKEEGPLRAETIEEIMTDPDLAVVEKYIDERIVYREDDQTLHLLFGYGYQIDLAQIQTPEHLLHWTRQLLGKPWMDNQRMIAFMDRVAQIKGFRIHGAS